MTKGKNVELRVVVLKDGEVYVAQCLELDISAQASDLKSLRHRMNAAIDAERDYANATGKSLDDIGKAPKHFFDMWEKAWGSERTSVDLRLALCA